MPPIRPQAPAPTRGQAARAITTSLASPRISSAIGDLIRDAGGPTLPDIPHGEFDNIFVLTYCECWRPKAELARSKYGAPSL